MICNDIDTENNFQIRAQEAGVRTPLPLISLETDKGPVFIMERIDGYSMKDICKKPELISKNFNRDIFFKSLEKQVSLMHRSGIYHRDLHWGNVMIDEKGLPVIIDFGTATNGSGSDFTYEESVMMFNEKLERYESRSGVFTDDIKNIDLLKEQFKNFI